MSSSSPKGVWSLLLLALLISSCAGRSESLGHPFLSSSQSEPSYANSACDVISTKLSLDLRSHRAVAVMTVDTGAHRGCSLQAQGIRIRQVTAAHPSRQLEAVVHGGRLHVDLLPSTPPIPFTIEYDFDLRSPPQGAFVGNTTLTWPYLCGYLFPCNSDPDDGSIFEIELTSLPPGQRAVYPRAIEAEAPAYMVAWTTGNYRRQDLGTTEAGTTVSVWFEPAEEERAIRGTRTLCDVFEWFEQTLGPYPYGDHVGSVVVNWGPSGGFGGMEHHPYWHIARGHADRLEVHAHEAAHGWFGNGVRLRCWEEFVLSEGTTSYLAARAVAAIEGESQGEQIWRSYGDRLEVAMESTSHQIAWPRTCGEIDILEGLFSPIPYMKGAFFFRALEGRIGQEALDESLAAFYETHRGRAAGFQDLLDEVESRTGFDPSVCAESWLRSRDIPAWDSCP